MKITFLARCYRDKERGGKPHRLAMTRELYRNVNLYIVFLLNQFQSDTNYFGFYSAFSAIIFRNFFIHFRKSLCGVFVMFVADGRSDGERGPAEVKQFYCLRTDDDCPKFTYLKRHLVQNSACYDYYLLINKLDVLRMKFSTKFCCTAHALSLCIQFCKSHFKHP